MDAGVPQVGGRMSCHVDWHSTKKEEIVGHDNCGQRPFREFSIKAFLQDTSQCYLL